ncbi:MAG: BON domain-containing protein [Marivibrio sp.]|uniref:BON domain-containing protein n=1 Tax=Marivibrio sp. TaxID=2039719 RepID=UPI0032F02327
MSNPIRQALAAGLLLLAGGLAACSPVTVAQRALEDRSVADIREDNRIVVAVNKLMAKYETVSVSTEIYEQHLLIYGILETESAYEGFRNDVGKIEGIERLYWHVEQMSEAEREAREDEMLGFAQGLKVKALIEKDWLQAEGVESLNFRVAVDPFAAAYILGRAKSQMEMERAIAVVRNTEGVRRVRNYAAVR